MEARACTVTVEAALPQSGSSVLWSGSQAGARHDIAKSYSKPIYSPGQESIRLAMLDRFDPRFKLWGCFRRQISFLLSSRRVDEIRSRRDLRGDDSARAENESRQLLRCFHCSSFLLSRSAGGFSNSRSI